MFRHTNIYIKEPSWMFGHTNGAFQGKQYFDHPCQVLKYFLSHIKIAKTLKK